MTDVDAIRWMASEHDLEFVDLDAYGVDPAAGDILPSDLARRLGMVAIKRKFGTPVIATSDPDDLYAQDAVRASIGRDFISVVAAPQQISNYLDQLFGPVPGDPASTGTDGAQNPQVDVVVDAPAPDVEDDVDDEITTAAHLGEAASQALDSLAILSPDPPLFDASEIESPSPEPTEDITGEPEPTVVASGRGRRNKEDRKRPRSGEPAHELLVSDTGPLTADAPDGLGDAPSSTVTADDGGNGAPGDPEDLSLPPEPMPPLIPMVDAAPSHPIDDAGAPGPVGTLTPGLETLEPATSVLPSFGADWTPPPHAPTDPLAASVDQLAELARSLRVDDQQLRQQSDNIDEAALAADLVDEAVATYQVQQVEDQGFDPSGFEQSTLDPPSGTSMFPPLAKALVDGGRVTLADMESVLEEHYRSEQSIARILTARKLVTEADLMWGMAQEMGLEFVDLDLVGVDYVEAGTIPESTARHHNVMVIANDNGTPVVAASNPTDVFAMDDLRTIMGRNFIVVVATRSQISAYIGKAFNSGGDAADMAMEASLGIEGQGSASGVADIQAITEEAPIVRYVNLLILQALNERASDVHIEPTATDLRIRYRIDGVLHEASTAPRSIAPAVTTRLKVMADMNIAEHRVPQDGRISLNVGSKGIDLRMATLPTIYGEKIVMRVLDKSSVVLGFADLGFEDHLLKTYEGLYTKPYGTILVTGPTGSGKSTTLYTTLTALNSPEKNIITVEDPVELPLKGVNQVQLNLKAGLNFASALRAILRSDPDIVLVGEVRDKETAIIAIEAALTGHMVLSTLHTNNAASTPMRLIEMGLEPFLVTSAVSGVLAQRLARRLCMHCKEAFDPTEADIVSAGWKMEEVEAMGGMDKVYRAVGCSACANTGYRGRKALAELMPMSEEIERSIIEGGSVEEIHRIAVTQGMTTLRQSGLRKAIEGETTLEEVLRVVA